MKLVKPLCVLLVLAFAPCTGSAAPADKTEHQQQALAQDALVAGIDPGTGTLRPLSDAETLALSIKAGTMTSASSISSLRMSAPRTATESRRTMRKHASGVTTVDLPLTSLSWLSASIDTDGTIKTAEGEPVLTDDSHGGDK